MREFEIDGEQFSSWEELSALLDPILATAGLVPDGFRVATLDGFAEALGGWFNEQGTDDDDWPPGKPDSFLIRWKSSEVSRVRLSEPVESIEAKRWMLTKYQEDPIWAEDPAREETEIRLRREIEQMEGGEEVGPTLYEVLVQTFLDHAPGTWNKQGDGVALSLE